LLDWLLEQPYANDVRALAHDELPIMFATLARNYSANKKNPKSEIDDADRIWGLMPASEYASAVFRTLERDWIPRFGARGINAQATWDKSQKV
jgi:hypothetical protein